MQGVSVTVGRVPIPFSGLGSFGGAKYLYARQGQARTPRFGQALDSAASASTLALVRTCLDRLEDALAGAAQACTDEQSAAVTGFTTDLYPSCGKADELRGVDSDLSGQLAHPDQLTESSAAGMIGTIESYVDCTDLLRAATDSPAAQSVLGKGTGSGASGGWTPAPKSTPTPTPTPGKGGGAGGTPGPSVPWFVWAGAGALVLVALLAGAASRSS